MILLRSSVIFLICVIICCQKSVSTASISDAQSDDQHQEPSNPTNKPEDPPKSDDTEKSDSDDKQLAARRRQCCDDGRQHFYMNGHCNNRSQEELEAVGPWCDQKFMQCCQFMVSYYMRRDEVRPCQSCQSCQINTEDAPKKEGHESEDKKLAVKRRKCCDDGRQHFYMNGHCNNRSQEELEAVGPWCDQKFMQCCQFMVSYYMRRDEVRPCQSQSCQSNKEDLPKKEEPETGAAALPVLPEEEEIAANKRKCCDDGRQHFYMNGHCNNRSKEGLEAVGPWCDSKFVECCQFMELYYTRKDEGSSCSSCKKVDTEESPQKDEDPKPDAVPDEQQIKASKRLCCDDGRHHFYQNGNCANRPKEKNEAVGPWCDPRFLKCCLFLESYYFGPDGGSPCPNKQQPSETPTSTNTPSVAKEGLDQ